MRSSFIVSSTPSISSDGIEREAHAAQRADEIGEALEREVFAVQRDEDRVGGDERVQREQSERGRRIDDEEVEARSQRIEEAAQPPIAIGQRNQLDLRAGEIARGGDDAEAVDGGREDEVLGDDDVAASAPGRWCRRPRLSFQPQAAGGVALRVGVDDEDGGAGEGERAAEVDGRGGLAHAALLVRDGYHLSSQRFTWLMRGSGSGGGELGRLHYMCYDLKQYMWQM